MINYSWQTLQNEILKSVILTFLKNFKNLMLLSDIKYTRTPSFSKFAEKLEEIEFSEFYLIILFMHYIALVLKHIYSCIVDNR